MIRRYIHDRVHEQADKQHYDYGQGYVWTHGQTDDLTRDDLVYDDVTHGESQVLAGTQLMRRSRTHIHAVAATCVMITATGALLAGCGEPTAVPMNDEFTSNSTQRHSNSSTHADTNSNTDSDGKADGDSSASNTTQGSNSAAGSNDQSQSQKDTGHYRDGTYDIKGQYGPIGEDTIDVHVTVSQGNISDVAIEGHPATSISKEHQDNFASHIGDAVIGKPLKGLSVDTVAGASWTTEAFNKALTVVREEASITE